MKRLSQAINWKNEQEKNVPTITYNSISIVIPVKDNQKGIDRFLNCFFELNSENTYPKEIIIIDNNSSIPIYINESLKNFNIDIILISCRKKGPASARNMGINIARGNWILFTDSDCIPTINMIASYVNSSEKAIGYTGNVISFKNGWLDKFYNTEEVLLPQRRPSVSGEMIPLYVVTANCLIYKEALLDIGLFDENFSNAGGEDVELSIRLWNYGKIRHVESSLVLHDFGDSFIDFFKRFYRYGKGNWQLEKKENVDMKPFFRKPKVITFSNYCGKVFQFFFMKVGYLKGKHYN